MRKVIFYAQSEKYAELKREEDIYNSIKLIVNEVFYITKSKKEYIFIRERY